MHYVSSQHNYAIAAQLQHGELRNSYTCHSCCFTGLINLKLFNFVQILPRQMPVMYALQASVLELILSMHLPPNNSDFKSYYFSHVLG